MLTGRLARPTPTERAAERVAAGRTQVLGVATLADALELLRVAD